MPQMLTRQMPQANRLQIFRGLRYYAAPPSHLAAASDSGSGHSMAARGVRWAVWDVREGGESVAHARTGTLEHWKVKHWST